jgi:hypothetical protein
VKSRKRKALLSLFGIIGLTLIINSYMETNEREILFPENLYGVPTYPKARVNYSMSSLNGSPYICVFLSGDPYENVLQFYKDKLKMNYKVLHFGRKTRPHMTMTVYQFEMEKGVLEKSINKGIEIIPLNHWSQRVYKAKTKIKIILPRQKVVELNREKEKADH